MAAARFSDEEVRRYSRQLVLSDVGGVGQERLRAARLRAQGEIEALYLAAAGVGTLEVSSSAIADAVRSLNPSVKIEIIADAGDDIASDESSVEVAAARALSKIAEAIAP